MCPIRSDFGKRTLTTRYLSRFFFIDLLVYIFIFFRCRFSPFCRFCFWLKLLNVVMMYNSSLSIFSNRKWWRWRSKRRWRIVSRKLRNRGSRSSIKWTSANWITTTLAKPNDRRPIKRGTLLATTPYRPNRWIDLHPVLSMRVFYSRHI